MQHLFGEQVLHLHTEQQPPLAETPEYVLKGRYGRGRVSKLLAHLALEEPALFVVGKEEAQVASI